jgi:polyphenol oxidase
MSFRLSTTAGGVIVGRFAHLPPVHGIAGRAGGCSDGAYASLNMGPRSGDDLDRVRENGRRFRAALGADGLTVLAPRQVHGAGVAVHRQGAERPPGGVYDGDGLLTDDPHVLLVVLAADCAAILLHDPTRGVVGALHAGWRGTAAGIAQAGIEAMRRGFGSRPADIRAGIGPAIGRCCYEVGIEVAAAVARATPAAPPPYDRRGGGKALLDITSANHAQLLGAGLDPRRVSTADICTACRTDLFYSHRREGEPTGRFGAAISLQT